MSYRRESNQTCASGPKTLNYVVLNVLVLAAAALAADALKITAEAPPGWTDVSAQQASGDVVLVLKGPETSSFVMTRLGPLEIENRAVVRSLLVDVLAALNKSSGASYTITSNVENATFDNGLTARYIRADLQGKPRLVLAVADFGGEPLLATLMSNVPEMILPSILSGLRGPAATLRAGPGSSLDGQLSFKLPAGLGARALTERERKVGFVFAVVGHGSELMVQKLVEDIGKASEQPQILKGTVLSMAGVDEASYAGPVPLLTPAGSELVYSWAKLGGGSQFAAGFLPWGYLGYSILAKGPNASTLLVDTFKTLEVGPSGTPKLVANSPRIPLSAAPHPLPALAIAALLFAVLAAALAWKRRQAV